MKINTLYFGELEYSKQEMFHFSNGLPGLEEHRDFLLIPMEEGVPFSYLQSLDEGSLSILVTNPFDYFHDYDFSMNEGTQFELQIEQPEDIEVWSAVTVTEDLNEVTVNLLAPIIVNSKKKLGRQIILHDSGYTTKHPLPLIPSEESIEEG
ncbi:flagellar assembly factor FliW [Paenibacillus sp. 1_12]|uniref:flagellar assembly protein FliW n=1 Tax=Paenibacillus sp. 1_12 TaxID=1566278 RepID=UPI0008E9B6ED|nr:flagellar assembly protein FliW [Paenibacillus sp. 1_12]SFL89115.1 flagellar assembly factor FliW [Paenibacillus sp. 1_12]